MNRTEQALRELLRKAKEGPRAVHEVERPFAAMPSMFAARVARRWAESGPSESMLHLWERYSMRWAIGSTSLAACVCLAVWATWTPLPAEGQDGLLAAMGEIVFLP